MAVGKYKYLMNEKVVICSDYIIMRFGSGQVILARDHQPPLVQLHRYNIDKIIGMVLLLLSTTILFPYKGRVTRLYHLQNLYNSYTPDIIQVKYFACSITIINFLKINKYIKPLVPKVRLGIEMCLLQM
jgi:hypothetical protein